jgi:hypothetical protein
MGFEKNYSHESENYIQRTPNQLEHPVLDRVHSKAQDALNKESIDPSGFIDLYGVENVTRDIRHVETLKSKFEKNEAKAAAEILEAIVCEHVELSNWLGPNAETIRTSEFDDIVNGVDMIVEFNEEMTTNHLALGIDVTFGSLSMQKKFDRIKGEIEKDTLANVKYFEAHGYKGSLRQLPRIVIGVELPKVVQLAGLWERGDKKTIGSHVTKEIIAQEIERQLRTFLIYAQSVHAESAIKSYTRALHVMRAVRTKRNGFSEDSSVRTQIEEDRVYQGILKNLERFRVTSARR